VPLSEHEQRLLEQIEQALYAEDPKFASIYRSNDLRSHQRRRVVRAAVALVVGLALLLAGVITKLPVVGVVGFVIMLAAVTFAVASWQRMVSPNTQPAPTTGRFRRRGRPGRPATTLVPAPATEISTERGSSR
jgi:type IV secretory pathway component VirB8